MSVEVGAIVTGGHRKNDTLLNKAFTHPLSYKLQILHGTLYEHESRVKNNSRLIANQGWINGFCIKNIPTMAIFY